MTTLATRTETRPAVIDGEVVQAEQTNPYTIHLAGSIAVVAIAAAGTVWSLLQDFQRADLAFGLLIGLVAVLTTYARRWACWQEG